MCTTVHNTFLVELCPIDVNYGVFIPIALKSRAAVNLTNVLVLIDVKNSNGFLSGIDRENGLLLTNMPLV